MFEPAVEKTLYEWLRGKRGDSQTRPWLAVLTYVIKVQKYRYIYIQRYVLATMLIKIDAGQ